MKKLMSCCVLGIAGCGGQMEPAASEEPPITAVYEACGAEDATDRQILDEFISNITENQRNGESRTDVLDALIEDTESTTDWPTLTEEEQQSTLLCLELSVDLVYGTR